jgi:hypothetical protein
MAINPAMAGNLQYLIGDFSPIAGNQDQVRIQRPDPGCHLTGIVIVEVNQGQLMRTRKRSKSIVLQGELRKPNLSGPVCRFLPIEANTAQDML